jgi:hypothetical protein
VLHAPVTVFHNVDPLSRDDDLDGDEQHERGAFGLRFEARLASAVRELPSAAIPVVRSEIDPAFALSDEMRKRDAMHAASSRNLCGRLAPARRRISSVPGGRFAER